MGDEIDKYLKDGQDQMDLAIANIREAVKSFQAAQGAGFVYPGETGIENLADLADALEKIRGNQSER